jgi:hypothetical protein
MFDAVFHTLSPCWDAVAVQDSKPSLMKKNSDEAGGEQAFYRPGKNLVFPDKN